MENQLFYAYLNWRKENSEKFSKLIMRTPLGALIILLFLCLSAIAFVLVIIFAREWIVIPMLATVVMVFISYFYTESVQTRRYKISYDKYKAKCKSLKKHFKDLINKDVNKEEMVEIRNRILEKINENEHQIERAERNLTTVLQTLIIPIALSFITKLIDGSMNLDESIYYTLSICACIGVFFLAVWGILHLCYSFVTYRNVQFREFADDLQGIIDFC